MEGVLWFYKHVQDSEQDTSLYVGSNNVAGDVKVDPDKFTLREKYGDSNSDPSALQTTRVVCPQ